MTMSLMPGHFGWSMTRDSEGHREYKIKHRVKSDDETDGPANAIRTAGLPVPGSIWDYDNDVDPYAYCKMDATVTPALDDQRQKFFIVEQTYSTKPDSKSCKDSQFENPLLMPMKVSGSFVKFTEERSHDRFGKRIRNSAWELIRGPHNEWDANRPQIKIEQNVLNLELDLFTQMIDTVNKYPLWGLPPRTIKLSSVPWSANFYGTCLVYYTRTLEFDIRYRRVFGISSEVVLTGTGTLNPVSLGDYETFDRDLLDEGTKVLRGHWRKDGHYILDKFGTIPPPTITGVTFDPSSGTLASGTYEYVVTSVNANGESSGSTPASVTIPLAGTYQIAIAWNAVPGATTYRLYGRYVNDWQLIDETENTNYVDDGGVTPEEEVEPPGSNTTGLLPDPTNPAHFIRFKDINDNVTRVILNGAGLPATVGIGLGTGTGTGPIDNIPAYSPGNIHVQAYGESDMLLLGIPTVLA